MTSWVYQKHRVYYHLVPIKYRYQESDMSIERCPFLKKLYNSHFRIKYSIAHIGDQGWEYEFEILPMDPTC